MLLKGHGAFLADHPQVSWRSIKDMRNRVAHVYFDINLDVVWRTVTLWIPELLRQLPAVREAAVAQA